jgi:enoyl-CoA hydratase/carnithine racemase
MDYKNIKFDVEGEIGIIKLNNPQKRNALSLELLKETKSLLDEVETRQDIKVLIIKGEGKVFSSGHDLAELNSTRMVDYYNIFNACGNIMKKIQQIPQPVIAQVHGIATAAGCQLVAACDLVTAEEGTLFGTPGVKIGVFCTAPAVPLVRAIGRKRALEMLFTGRLISAQEALHYGLVNGVFSAAQLETETKALALRIAEASSLTLAFGKRIFYAQVNLPDANAYDLATMTMVSNFFAEDAKEGVAAFKEKRKPKWTGL